jgi:hypothetical protein
MDSSSTEAVDGRSAGVIRAIVFPDHGVRISTARMASQRNSAEVNRRNARPERGIRSTFKLAINMMQQRKT